MHPHQRRQSGRRFPTTLDPKTLRKASDIIGRDLNAGIGNGVAIDPALRKDDAIGYSREVFAGGHFEVVHKVISPDAAIGLGLHPTGERVLWVLGGLLYVTLDLPNGGSTLRTVAPGAAFIAPPGTRYGLATDGTSDAVLLMVQTPGYELGWKQIEANVSPLEAPPMAEYGVAELSQDRSQQSLLNQAWDRQMHQPHHGGQTVGPPPPASEAVAGAVAQSPQPMRVSQADLDALGSGPASVPGGGGFHG